MPDSHPLGGGGPFRRIGGKASREGRLPCSGWLPAGLALPLVRSALATTRRGQPQPSRVRRGVREASARLAAARGPTSSLHQPPRPARHFSPSRTDTPVPLAPHHVIEASRVTSASARGTTSTSGRSSSNCDTIPYLPSRNRRTVDVRPPQLRSRKMTAAEDIQRQMAMAVATAV